MARWATIGRNGTKMILNCACREGECLHWLGIDKRLSDSNYYSTDQTGPKEKKESEDDGKM